MNKKRNRARERKKAERDIALRQAEKSMQAEPSPQGELPPQVEALPQIESLPQGELPPQVVAPPQIEPSLQDEEPAGTRFDNMPWGSVAALAVLCVASLVTGIVYWYNNYYSPSGYDESAVVAQSDTMQPTDNIFGFHDIAGTQDIIDSIPTIDEDLAQTPVFPSGIAPFPEFVELWEQYGNSDIVGILHLADSEELILQANDNSFYLTHNINREQSATGQAFLDYTVDLIMGEDNNMVVYIPRGIAIREVLREYSNYDFFLMHPNLTFATLFGDFEWEIFSFYVSPNTLSFMTVNHEDNYSWGEAVMHFTLASLYNTRLDVTEFDQIITIVSPTDGDLELYYVLQARMLRQITS